jgi:hypothetical protein
MQKRLVVIFIAVLFIIAIVPALYQPADATPRKSSSYGDAYDQLFTAAYTPNDLNYRQSWIRVFNSFETSYNLPKALPSSAETRAPPA